jgi:hypothetical protein
MEGEETAWQEEASSRGVDLPLDVVPEGMRAFVASNGLPADAYQLRGLYRFVRLNPRLWATPTTTALTIPTSTSTSSSGTTAATVSVPSENAPLAGEAVATTLALALGGGADSPLVVEPVEWLPGFYRLPHSAALSDSDLYLHPARFLTPQSSSHSLAVARATLTTRLIDRLLCSDTRLAR